MAGSPTDADERKDGVSRAGVVRVAAAGLIGAVGATLAAPGPADAHTVDSDFVGDGSQNQFGVPAFSTEFESGYPNDGANIGGQTSGVTGRSLASGGADGSSGGSGYGVAGYSGTGAGVYGSSASATGVHGVTGSSAGIGVLGEGTLTADGVRGTSGGFGVHGSSTSPRLAGVFGESTNGGDGVLGSSAGNGVHGITTNVNAYGVFGENSAGGYGVYGTTSSSGRAGVWGQNTDASGAGAGVEGDGVVGVSGNGSAVGVSGTATTASGTGVRAIGDLFPGGVALAVLGRAQFSNAGVATVAGTTATPLSSVKVTGVTLTASSFVLAMPQTHAAGVWVVSVVPHPNTTDPAKSSLTIYLNKAVTATITIGWFAIN
jgi:hypothetical protein